ncbi:MAG TPA: hypothetical protein VNA69_08710 [Thermoanaerobaculia bacterium]|nr:hypothetical protein [Thermoanaerobaculia bacterium]
MLAKRLSRIGVLTLATFVASPLLADSDGDFCTTSSYLAYEVGLPGYSPHELRVVSLVPPLSDSSLRVIRLPDFQVHGILCREAEVLLLGWDHLYTVSVLPAGELLAARSEKLAHPGQRPSFFRGTKAVQNLGSVAKEQILPITTSNANFLLVTRITRSHRECELRVVSSLQETDHEGLLRFALQLYDGTKGAECGE